MPSGADAVMSTPPFGITYSSPVHLSTPKPCAMQIDLDVRTSSSQAQGSVGDMQEKSVADTLAGTHTLRSTVSPLPSDSAKGKAIFASFFEEAHKAGLQPFNPSGTSGLTLSEDVRMESGKRNVQRSNTKTPTEGVSH